MSAQKMKDLKEEMGAQHDALIQIFTTEVDWKRAIHHKRN